MDSMSEEIIELRNVTFGYSPDQPIFRNMDWTVCAGERVGLLGPNASGKSTLLHILMGLRRIQSGEVNLYGRPRLEERDFREVRSRMGLMFQDSDDQLFCPTVLDDVAFGPLHLGATPAEAESAAIEALELVGLQGYEERITHRLSAGEKQCVALATNLAMRPDTLLLDEPTSCLDKSSRARVLDVLAQLPCTLVIVSHDPDFIKALATTRYELRDGRLEQAVRDTQFYARNF